MTQKNTLLVVGLITLFTASINAAAELPSYEDTIAKDEGNIFELCSRYRVKQAELEKKHIENAKVIKNATALNMPATKAQIEAFKKSEKALAVLGEKMEALKGKAVEIKGHIANS